MSVGDIQIWYPGEFTGYGFDRGLVVDHPKMVAESVGSREIIFRRSFRDISYDALKHVIVGESEEYRLDIGIVDPDMLHAVLLLVAAR